MNPLMFNAKIEHRNNITTNILFFYITAFPSSLKYFLEYYRNNSKFQYKLFLHIFHRQIDLFSL